MAHQHSEDLSEEENAMLKKMVMGLLAMPLLGFGSLILKIVAKEPKKRKRGGHDMPPPPPAPRP